MSPSQDWQRFERGAGDRLRDLREGGSACRPIGLAIGPSARELSADYPALQNAGRAPAGDFLEKESTREHALLRKGACATAARPVGDAGFHRALRDGDSVVGMEKTTETRLLYATARHREGARHWTLVLAPSVPGFRQKGVFCNGSERRTRRTMTTWRASRTPRGNPHCSRNPRELQPRVTVTPMTMSLDVYDYWHFTSDTRSAGERRGNGGETSEHARSGTSSVTLAGTVLWNGVKRGPSSAHVPLNNASLETAASTSRDQFAGTLVASASGST